MLTSLLVVTDNDAEKEQSRICRNRAVRVDTDEAIDVFGRRARPGAN